MLSINRIFFLSLGGVCFLFIPFLWLALLYDYRSLENIFVNLSKSYLVGYPLPELFGASKIDSTVSQVFRLKIFFSLVLLAYSLFFIALYSVEENVKRFKILFRGLSAPIFLMIAAFWIKFVNEDHIVSKSEKEELFLLTIVCLSISIILFVYSLKKKKKKISSFKNPSNFSSVNVSKLENSSPNDLSGEKDLVGVVDSNSADNLEGSLDTGALEENPENEKDDDLSDLEDLDSSKLDDENKLEKTDQTEDVVEKEDPTEFKSTPDDNISGDNEKSTDNQTESIDQVSSNLDDGNTPEKLDQNNEGVQETTSNKLET